MSDDKAPADDLRSILSASFDEAMTPAAADAPAADIKPAAADPVEPIAAEPEPKDGERVRAKDGKYAKKDAAPEPKAVDDKTKPEEPVKTESKKDGEEPKADDKPLDAKTDAKGPPENWSASDKALFKMQNPDAQAFLLRRHSAMEADYTKKVGAIADLKKEYEPVQQLFSPYLDTLKQKGLTPQSVIRRWADVETALAGGRGIDIISGLIQGYNIDKAALGKALGFTSTSPAQPGTEPAAADPAAPARATPVSIADIPELAELRARFDRMEADRISSQTRAARDRETQVETEITNFKSAATDKGELLHPFYEEVEPAMVALASSYVASKQPIPPLAELYETAVWANPSTRAAILASHKAAEQSKLADEARAKAARARNAGSSVTGAPGSGQATRQIKGEQTLREQLEEAAADLG